MHRPIPNGSATRSPSPVPSVPHLGRTRNGTALSYLRHSVSARLQPPTSAGAQRNSTFDLPWPLALPAQGPDQVPVWRKDH